jgi:hypothetical protein
MFLEMVRFYGVILKRYGYAGGTCGRGERQGTPSLFSLEFQTLQIFNTEFSPLYFLGMFTKLLFLEN